MHRFSMAIVLMIFVNSGGGDYWWIEHAPWNGLHLADVVFPSFLWIMGVCIPISIKSQVARGTPKARICRRIIWVRSYYSLVVITGIYMYLFIFENNFNILSLLQFHNLKKNVAIIFELDKSLIFWKLYTLRLYCS